MKVLFSISFCILTHSLFSQVYIIQFDTITYLNCNKDLTIENMVQTGKYDIIKVISDPSVMTIHLGMMLIFGQNGEIEITDVIDKVNSFQIILNGTTRLTIKKNIYEKYIMFFEDMKSEGGKKGIVIFSDIKFVNTE